MSPATCSPAPCRRRRPFHRLALVDAVDHAAVADHDVALGLVRVERARVAELRGCPGRRWPCRNVTARDGGAAPTASQCSTHRRSARRLPSCTACSLILVELAATEVSQGLTWSVVLAPGPSLPADAATKTPASAANRKAISSGSSTVRLAAGADREVDRVDAVGNRLVDSGDGVDAVAAAVTGLVVPARLVRGDDGPPVPYRSRCRSRRAVDDGRRGAACCRRHGVGAVTVGVARRQVVEAGRCAAPDALGEVAGTDQLVVAVALGKSSPFWHLPAHPGRGVVEYRRRTEALGSLARRRCRRRRRRSRTGALSPVPPSAPTPRRTR